MSITHHKFCSGDSPVMPCLDILRLLTADDVGNGKAIESEPISREMSEWGETFRPSVLSPPDFVRAWKSEPMSWFYRAALTSTSASAGGLVRVLLHRGRLSGQRPIVVGSLGCFNIERYQARFPETDRACVIVDKAPASLAQSRLAFLKGTPDRYIRRKPMPQLKMLTDRVVAFRDERDWQQFHNLKDLALSLMLEAAEVLELYQWKTGEEIAAVARDRPADLSDELADVLYYTLLMAHEEGIDLEQALLEKLKKSALKYPVEAARGSSKKYTDL